MNTLRKTGIVAGKLLAGFVLFAVLGTAANYADSFTGIKISSCGGHTNTWLGENVFALGYGVEYKDNFWSTGILFVPGRFHVESYSCSRED